MGESGGRGGCGEESPLPHRSIPRALVISVAMSGAFFVLMVYAATIGFGPARVAEAWGAHPLAFAGLGDRYVGRPMGAVLSLGILIDNLAVQMAVANTASRGYFALARDGLLPRPLSWVSRHETPAGGLTLVSAAGLGTIVVAAFFENHFDVFEFTLVAATLTLALVYFGLAGGSLRLVDRWPLIAVPLVVAGGSVPVLGVYGTLHPFPSSVARVGIWLALASVVGVMGWYGYLRSRHPRRIMQAASHMSVADPPAP